MKYMKLHKIFAYIAIVALTTVAFYSYFTSHSDAHLLTFLMLAATFYYYSQLNQRIVLLEEDFEHHDLLIGEIVKVKDKEILVIKKNDSQHLISRDGHLPEKAGNEQNFSGEQPKEITTKSGDSAPLVTSFGAESSSEEMK